MITGIRSRDYSLTSASQVGVEGGARPAGPGTASSEATSQGTSSATSSTSTDVATWTDAQLRKAANQGNQDAVRELDRRAEVRARAQEQQRKQSDVLDTIDASRFQVTASRAGSSSTGTGSEGGSSGNDGRSA